MGLLDGKKVQTTSTVSPKIAEFDRQMAALEKRKQEVITTVGQLYVDVNTVKQAAGTVFEEPLKEIQKIKEELIVLEKRKLAAQGMRKCEKCGNILVLDSAFCNKCGEKLEALFIATEENPYVCSKCGTPYTEGTVFCTKCGNKLTEIS